jgi:PKD repeat protein
MRPRPISRFLALASKIFPMAPLVFAAAVAGTAVAARDAFAGTDVALSSSAAQRATQVSGEAPVLVPPSAMTVLVNETADQTLHATDAQGDPVTFSVAFGPGYMTVTTTDPGTGSATGNIHLAPVPGDEGLTQASVAASDGFLTTQQTFSIRVTTPSAPPVLDPVADMTVAGGGSASQALHASDPNDDELTFYVASGPSYATVSTVDPIAGVGALRLTPTFAVSGSATIRVGVTDGFGSDEQSLTATVTRVEVAPVLTQPASVTVRGGEVKDVLLLATDANGDPLTFSLVSGPSYMTVTTGDPGTGSAFGHMHFAPPPSTVDTVTAIVSVSDGGLSHQRAVFITVRANSPPVLDPVYNITMQAGGLAIEYVRAVDSEADPLLLTLSNAPSWATIFTYYEYPGFIYGQVDLHPTLSDVGADTVTVRVSDGISFDEKSFHVFVQPPPSPPILSQPAAMTATVGEAAEQTVTATDAEGNYIQIYKGSGPPYMSVLSSNNYGNASAIIRLLPGAGDVGTTTGSIIATDFTGSVTKTFAISVVTGNFPPPCPASSFTQLSTAFGYGAIDVQTADLNDDGVLDLVVEMLDGQRVATALGIGDGTFGPINDLDAGTGPVSGVIADLNQDQIPDIAVTNYYGQNVSVYLGDGTGAFGPRKNFAVGSYPRGIVAADVNRDGKADLLVANTNVLTVSVLRGVGDGTFLAATNIAVGGYPNQIAAPDLNGDGAPDLVVPNSNGGVVAVLLNNGTGSFLPKTDYPVGTYPSSVAAADLNGDGKIDLAVGGYSMLSIAVLLGNGDGTLGAARKFVSNYGVEEIAIVDLNGDSYPDLGATGNNQVSLWLGDGAGAFAPRTDLTLPEYDLYGITTGDFDDDLRPDLAVTSYYNGSVTLLLNNACAPDLDHPPVVKAPKNVTVAEGVALSFSVTASDPDGPAVTGLTASFAGLPLGNNATFTANGAYSAGTVTWTPTFMDSRPTPYPVTITATNVLSGSAMTKITVTNANRGPQANAGGPYTAFMGTPLAFDGRASSDPDGDPLGYAWVFGDGFSGTGAQPAHAYAAVGVYGVALTVSDGSLTSLATTTASIVGLFQARAFTASGNRNIRLNAGKPQWCVQIEAIARAFVNETIDMGSLVMRSVGTGSVEEIHAVGTKTIIGGDKDGNGVEEISACFGKEDLRLLFSNVHGTGSATVSFEADLYTGGRFRATMDVGIIAGGGNLAATISPNPLNPSATITYFTTRPGAVSLHFFDLHGRLVRTVLHEARVEPGYHDVPVDGKDDRGAPLASGVYYYRLHAAEGATTGRFTVLR